MLLRSIKTPHAKAYVTFEETPHAKAYVTFEETPHAKAYVTFEETPHAKAYVTFILKLKIIRNRRQERAKYRKLYGLRLG